MQDKFLNTEKKKITKKRKVKPLSIKRKALTLHALLRDNSIIQIKLKLKFYGNKNQIAKKRT